MTRATQRPSAAPRATSATRHPNPARGLRQVTLGFCAPCPWRGSSLSCEEKARSLTGEFDGLTLQEARISIFYDCLEEDPPGGASVFSKGMSAGVGLSAAAGIVVLLLFLAARRWRRRREERGDAGEGGRGPLRKPLRILGDNDHSKEETGSEYSEEYSVYTTEGEGSGSAEARSPSPSLGENTTIDGSDKGASRLRSTSPATRRDWDSPEDGYDRPRSLSPEPSVEIWIQYQRGEGQEDECSGSVLTFDEDWSLDRPDHVPGIMAGGGDGDGAGQSSGSMARLLLAEKAGRMKGRGRPGGTALPRTWRRKDSEGSEATVKARNLRAGLLRGRDRSGGDPGGLTGTGDPAGLEDIPEISDSATV